MPILSASAPGKIILFGEHAVVYGQPAIAAPVTRVRAKAFVSADPLAEPGSVRLRAPDIGLDAMLSDLAADHPLGKAVRSVFDALGISHPPAFQLRISSTIPLASGMGSGAAVSVALIKAVAGFLGHPFDKEEISALAFEIEKIHHGTPSGIDNTVIAFEKPVFFIKGELVELLAVPEPFTIVIADTGVSSPTAAAVGDVRRAYQQAPMRYGQLFEQVGQIARQARDLIETGAVIQLGALMDENHALLQEIDVSSAELDALVCAARQAGAWGAKLSGGGRGGNMIALAAPGKTQAISQALMACGAKRTLTTRVRQPEASDDI